jgi:hypothetical protein
MFISSIFLLLTSLLLIPLQRCVLRSLANSFIFQGCAHGVNVYRQVRRVKYLPVLTAHGEVSTGTYSTGFTSFSTKIYFLNLNEYPAFLLAEYFQLKRSAPNWSIFYHALYVGKGLSTLQYLRSKIQVTRVSLKMTFSPFT